MKSTNISARNLLVILRLMSNANTPSHTQLSRQGHSTNVHQGRQRECKRLVSTITNTVHYLLIAEVQKLVVVSHVNVVVYFYNFFKNNFLSWLVSHTFPFTSPAPWSCSLSTLTSSACFMITWRKVTDYRMTSVSAPPPAPWSSRPSPSGCRPSRSHRRPPARCHQRPT